VSAPLSRRRTLAARSHRAAALGLRVPAAVASPPTVPPTSAVRLARGVYISLFAGTMAHLGTPVALVDSKNRQLKSYQISARYSPEKREAITADWVGELDRLDPA
jgi:hypothetical protein